MDTADCGRALRAHGVERLAALGVSSGCGRNELHCDIPAAHWQRPCPVIYSVLLSKMASKSKALWKADDQQARLAELTARSDDATKDHPLRRDVRSLGAILGQTL